LRKVAAKATVSLRSSLPETSIGAFQVMDLVETPD